MEEESPPPPPPPPPPPQEEEEAEQRVREVELAALEYGGKSFEAAWPWKGRKGNGGGVMLEGYVGGWDEGPDGGGGGGVEGAGVGRTKSLTDDDLEELKGCLDLGFGFSYEEIPGLCTTLPALELCYSMNQRFEQQRQQQPSVFPMASREGGDQQHALGASNPIANWKFSSPGDHPEEVKARLKYWAQAVACTVRLCS